MGYTTDFYGELTISPNLTPEQVAYLQAFNRTRRMMRKPDLLDLPDPKRAAVGLLLGKDCEYFVGSEENYGQIRDLSIIDYNQPPESQPGLWCQWTVSDDGSTLMWDEGEKFYDYVPWLVYLIQHFFKPWGRVLNGEIEWIGEDSDDRGTIYVADNQVEAITAEIRTPRPSWEREAKL